jgi:hypothetical protein
LPLQFNFGAPIYNPSRQPSMQAAENRRPRAAGPYGYSGAST